jgi:hypothetical protein
MIHFFTGEYDGKRFIGARASVADESEQLRAGATVDALSRVNGPKIPTLNAAKCLIRELSPGVLPHTVEDRLANVPQAKVHYAGAVTIEQLEPFFTPEEVEDSLKAPKTASDELAVA